ncbi:MAG: RNA polymerase sigma factor [Saprospiraceae bacterium]
MTSIPGILQAIAYNLTKDFEESRDLFQETAFRASKTETSFSGHQFQSLVVYHHEKHLHQQLQKKGKANTIIDTTDNQFYLNSGSKTVTNNAESTIMMKELNKMITKLDDSIKIPFLRHFEGYKYQEIADEMELPLGTVKSRIFFARKELKDMIYKKYGMTPNVRD